MRRMLSLVALVCAMNASAATYYVSASGGSDANNGTSTATAWKTLGKVNTSTFAPGDTIYLKRGDVWNEALLPASSGSAGNLITFDAYPVGNTGPAPRITGLAPLTNWTNVSGNLWRATYTSGNACSTYYVNVLFKGVIGAKQASSGAVAHDREFYTDCAGNVYVYAESNPVTYYAGTIGIILPAAGTAALIDTNGKSHLQFQHIQLDYFDTYGMYVSGASTDIVIGNMSAIGYVTGGQWASAPGKIPYGFEVNTTVASSVVFVNVDAHLNYNGFNFDGYLAGSTITLTGCRAFANRNYGLWDNTTGGAVTINHSHFYGNQITAIGPADMGAVTGGTIQDGGGNIPQDTPPVVQGLSRFPAVFSFTIDDVGLYIGTEDYIDTLVPVFDARRLKMNMAVTAGYAEGYAPIAPRLNAWFEDGHEVDSHSWSHEYYTNIGTSGSTNMFGIRYTGAGTAATMAYSGTTHRLTTTVTGGPGGQNLSIDVTAAPYNTVSGLVDYLNSNYAGVYAASLQGITNRVDNNSLIPPLSGSDPRVVKNPMHTVAMADISTPVNIKVTAPAWYVATFDTTRFWVDEIKASHDWLVGKVAGMASDAPMVYVYPGGWNSAESNGMLQANGYAGGRGQINMRQPGNTGPSPLTASDLVAAGRGIDINNIISLTPTGAGWDTQGSIDKKIAALVFKASAWGLPVGLFAHAPDGLTAQQVGWILDAITSRHGLVKKNAELVTYIASGPLVPTTTRYLPLATGPVPVLRTAASSPDALAQPAGAILYSKDILGNTRSSTGSWDIGAYPSGLWGTAHGSAGTGKFSVYGQVVGWSENSYCLPGDVAAFGSTDGPATLPQQCVYTAMAGSPSPGTVRTVASDCSDMASTITAAVAGDTIVIPSTATCVGTYTFPPKSGADRNHWITVRTDQIANSSFPAEGTRATPCEIGLASVNSYPTYSCPNPGVRMPTISTGTNNTPAITVSGSFYRFIGLNVTKQASATISGYLLNMQYTDHVILDRMLFHGSANMDFKTKCAVFTGGTYQAIVNSWLYDIDWNQPDGYAIAGGVGDQTDEGPMKVYNNLVAGASETWIFGGGSRVAWPHDYEFRRNHSMKPWKWMIAVNAPGGTAAVNVKNLGEFKDGNRILYEGNVFENLWSGLQGDQPGLAIVLTPKNQGTYDQTKFVNVSGSTISCASDASGTPCASGAGIWGVPITSVVRTGGMVTVTVNTTIAHGWPLMVEKLYGLTGACSIFNGEHVITNSPYPYGPYSFPMAGADVSCTGLSGPFMSDYAVSSCAPGGCRFYAPSSNSTYYHVTDVIDPEHISIIENAGTMTGSTQKTCKPGQNPLATVQDMTFRYNVVRHARGVGIALQQTTSACGDESTGSSNFSIHDVISDDIDGEFYWGSRNGCCGRGGEGTTISNTYTSPDKFPHDVSIRHVTYAGIKGWPSGTISAGGLATDDVISRAYTVTNLVRTSGVTTLTLSTAVSYAAGNVIDVNGFTGAYTTFNAPVEMFTLTGTTAYSVTFDQPGQPDVASTAVTSGTTGAGTVTAFPATYFKNITWTDNIVPGPFRLANYTGRSLSGGVVQGLATNMCNPLSPYECTWTMAKNLIGTALYSGYTQVTSAPYPASNTTCGTGSASCLVADFSNVFVNWGNGLGDTSANDYHLKPTSPYKGQATDGKDLGADVDKVNQLISGTVSGPAVTAPLVIATSSLPAGTVGVQYQQNLTISSGASGASGFVKWKLLSGTLPSGMTFEGNGFAQTNGQWLVPSAGWLGGTPTQSGSFPLTFQAEDAAHQKSTVSLTLVVN